MLCAVVGVLAACLWTVLLRPPAGTHVAAEAFGAPGQRPSVTAENDAVMFAASATAAPAAAPAGTATHAPSGATPAPPESDDDPASPWAPHDLSDDAARQAWSDAVLAREAAERPTAESVAAKAGVPASGDNEHGAYQFLSVRDGRPYVRTTRNLNSAISAGANLVGQPPYNLNGTGMTVAVWDAGSVRVTHQEFAGRLTLRDSVAAHHHSAHVGGTIGAAGIDGAARGMAPAVRLDSYDWNSDAAEMIQAAMATPGQAGKIQLSNHSYGFQSGWQGSTWYSTWGISREADSFGLYDFYAAEQDAICYNAPYYLPFKAAGNDRIDTAPSEGALFTYFDGTGAHIKAYDSATDPYGDNWDDGGYDTISLESNAKNILTVGAVNDSVSGGLRSLAAATMSSFSSWGPSDDGRIKPDLVANGVNLYSSGASSDSSYLFLSGTSMAAPSAMGSAALVVQRYGQKFPGFFMRASMLKGLLIHKADDVGAPGPDYQFGWGLINTLAAVQHVDAHAAHTNAQRMIEGVLSNANPTNTHRVLWDRVSPIRATLCWTDPPGVVRSGVDNRAPSLVNDLDLRVIAPGGAVALPFVLSVTNPAAHATPGDNGVDNVEQVFIAVPPVVGEYEVRVSVDKALTNGVQVYALLISGVSEPPAIAHTPLANTTNSATPYVVEARINSEAALVPGSLLVRWNTQTPADPFFDAPLTLVSNDLYRADIPPQAQGAHVNYYIVATATNGITGQSPAGAPAQVHSFSVVPSVMLFVAGQPVAVPGVVPPYGFTAYPFGVTVQVSAPRYSVASNGVRDVCTGWIGCCDFTASTTTNAFSFVITADNFLAWQWRKAYALTQTASLTGLVDATTWWVGGATGETATATLAPTVGGTNYQFVGWYVDGTRLPDATNRATNPAQGIVMLAPRAAQAVYLPATQDADGDGVVDWWELYFFGSTNTALNVDSDGDGYSNLKEYQDKTDPRNDQSVPAPPSIAHTPLTNPQGLPAPWAVTASVVDNDTVDRVLLEWQRNGGAWQSITMGVTLVSGVYTSAIAAPGVTGDACVYRLVARDGAGLAAANGPYPVSVAYPVATAAPSDFGTLFLAANSGRREFLNLGNNGHAGMNWTLRHYPIGLRDDVEGGTNGWTHGGVEDVWHIAAWRAYSGTNAWYYGSDLSRQYPDNAKAWLMSPPVQLGSNAVFSFRQWLSTEALQAPTHAWDGAIVEISTNQGATFSQIAPVDGYPYRMYGHSASPFPHDTPCFAGTGGWQQVQFKLGAYAGSTARLRLTFGSDGFVVNEGWYVDDLTVTPYGGADNWISFDLSNGVVAAQQSVAVPLNLRSHTLSPGETRQAILYASTDDPLNPFRVVPIALHNTTREIQVQVTGPGSVTPPGPVWVNLGASTSFWVAADNYHHLADLRTNGAAIAGAFGMAATNYTWANVAFAGTGTLHAVFAPNVTTNGVPEPWLAAFGLTNGVPADEALADQDADKMPAWAEYQAGTDPTDWASRLAIETMIGEGTWIGADTNAPVLRVENLALTWGSVSGRVYTVQEAPRSCAAFLPLSPPLAATPPLNTYTGAVSTQGVYRIGVTWPDN
ncbi:MAG: S8 family serine peptidase [Verrucomicrobia bacterium]|nr:S8 family serine peptidase [Verrucomicrobiota bacterium]